MAIFNDLGRNRKIAIAGVGRGSDIGLIDLASCQLAHWHYISRAAWLCDQWFQSGQINLLVTIVFSTRISDQLNPIFGAGLFPQKLAHLRSEERRVGKE